MTPDQVRLRLEQIRPASGRRVEDTVRGLHALLEEVLPDLLAQAAGRSHEDAGRRYGDTAPLSGVSH